MFIEEELAKGEFYLSQGYDFQEVFQVLKNSIEAKLSKSPNLLKFSQVENTRSLSTEKPHPNRYSLLSIQNPHKKTESWQDYTEKHQKFFHEFNKISSNLEKAQINSYRKTPSLEFQSKFDEVKALEAAKMREMQAQEMEYKKRIGQLVAERENVRHLTRQILEKRSEKNNLRQENKLYRNEIEDRSNYMKLLEQSERERKNIEREIYSQALNNQISMKNKEKARVQELDKYSKRISASERSISESEYSAQSGSSSILPSPSPLRFLVQYGNYIPIKKSLSKPCK